MTKSSRILVTGGAGYIGSHACVELLQAGYDVIVADNLCNSNMEAITRIQRLTHRTVDFFRCDMRDKEALTRIFASYPISAVMHFAGLKAVGESCEKPLLYYDNNVSGTVTLLEVMAEANVKNLVFSSSATVYGNPGSTEYFEDFALNPVNPYGRSKAMIEDVLRDLSASDTLNKNSTPWKIILLRYFNPIGAHESGMLGEDPFDIPNNLMPYISRVAIGKLAQLSVFGDDYPTRDGTGVRDYIHVVDLVKGHLKALEALEGTAFADGGCKAYNLGTGHGYSVLEIISAFEKASGRTINYKIAPRRAGDLAEYFANPDRALAELNWKAEKSLHDMVADTWNWQEKNPDGYLTGQI